MSAHSMIDRQLGGIGRRRQLRNIQTGENPGGVPKSLTVRRARWGAKLLWLSVAT